MTSTLDDARGELLALAEALSKGFMTARAYVDYQIIVSFDALADMQAAHTAIVSAIAAARAAPVPQCDAEPVAWRYELAHCGWDKQSYGHWNVHLSTTEPHVPEGSIRNLTPLYATALVSPPSEAGREMDVWRAIENMEVVINRLRRVDPAVINLSDEADSLRDDIRKLRAALSRPDQGTVAK